MPSHFDKAVMRSSTILTASYVASSSLHVAHHRRAALFISLTRNAGSGGNTVAIKVEYSFDSGSTWYQMSAESIPALVAGSTTSATLQTLEYSFNDEASGANLIILDLDTLQATDIRIQAKETADVANPGTLLVTGLARD